jgi:predicted nucleic acid-binding protein
MIAYLDTSAFAPLFLADEPAEAIRGLVKTTDVVACSRLGFVEMLGLLHRRRSSRQLSEAEFIHAAGQFERWFQECYAVDVNAAVVAHCSRLLRKHVLKTGDAIHLATALVIRERQLADIGFATGDLQLRRAAEGERFRVLPVGPP